MSITEDLVHRAASGERPALDALFTRLHADVRQIVASLLKRGRGPITATDIVDRVYERLARQTDPKWKDRAHFLRFVVLIARQTIIDCRRSRRSITLDATNPAVGPSGVTLFEVHECLQLLERSGRAGPRMAEVVLLRCLTDLGWMEIANVLGVSERTVKGDWSFSRAFLRAKIDWRDE